MERKQNVEGLFIKTNQTLFMVFKTRFILTVKMSYKCPFISPFCLPSGKADDTPISGACIQAHAKARSRWLLLRSSIRHSPLDALDLGHPQLSLNQGGTSFDH